jgi:hypothetical protein
MFEAIAFFLVILSAGIIIAHALDAFRSWNSPEVMVAEAAAALAAGCAW